MKNIDVMANIVLCKVEEEREKKKHVDMIDVAKVLWQQMNEFQWEAQRQSEAENESRLRRDMATVQAGNSGGHESGWEVNTSAVLFSRAFAGASEDKRDSGTTSVPSVPEPAYVPQPDPVWYAPAPTPSISTAPAQPDAIHMPYGNVMEFDSAWEYFQQ